MSATAVKTEIKLKNILLATDFSEVSEAVLPYAIDLARRYGSKIFAIHAVEPIRPVTEPLEIREEESIIRGEAEQTMTRFVGSTAFTGIPHQGIVKFGHISDVVRRAIQENAIDVVVLATHGRIGVKHLVLGSIAEQIFRHASCPVMTIGPHAKWSPNPEQRGGVLYATDFSDDAERALPYAIAMARNTGVVLTALHVVEPILTEGMDLNEQLVSGGEKALREKVPAPPGAPAFKYVVKLAGAAEGIVRTAAEEGSDLIVMGLHPHSAFATHFPWLTAHGVVVYATCPVLTVR